ncbi:MAG: acyl-CoA thioesterase [Verrucomicrobia bacterium]|nr:acyl-CoA thioesterase [Verrucomicrobiota bacterium]
MESKKQILESKVRIQYQDCDPFNHLNNSKYIDYIVAARTEQLLDNYDFNTAEIAKQQGIGWVAAQTQISYLYPAIWFETVLIETKLISFSESSLLLEAIMLNENKTHIKAIMWAKLVHFNIKAQRSFKHSEELMNFFGQIHYPIENNSTFEERVKILKQINQ